MDVSTIIPITQLVQGDTWNITVNLTGSGYTASAYVLTYWFKKVGVAKFSVVSTANPDGSFLMYATAATTETYTPGDYSVIATITNIADAERYTLCTTTVTITPDLASSSLAFDPRSPNKIILDQIDTALAACLTDATVEYTIGGRTVKMNKTELLKLRTYYAAVVRKESGIQQGNIIRYGFAPLQQWWF